MAAPDSQYRPRRASTAHAGFAATGVAPVGTQRPSATPQWIPVHGIRSRSPLTPPLKPEFFAEVNDGTVTLTFHFWSGTQLTYRLTKSGTSVTGSTA
ncbi:hypothetical protein [Plantactinospora sonchi]|uniref:Endoglucanase B carbohydrate binding domain-containing protein n=1 Tax=Plantactinospora sonchi TaxID=1544735 RepID=A0ABU7S230_9ACTN